MTYLSRHEAGSAFFLILISISLFAALSYAIMRDRNGDTSIASAGQTKLISEEIISFGNEVAAAVQKLKLKGCTNEQISFRSNNGMSRRSGGTVYDYMLTPNPADFSCDVFHINGGGVNARIFPQGTIPKTMVAAAYMDAQSFIITATRVKGMGDDSVVSGTDLLLWIGRLTESQCKSINDVLGVPNPNGQPPIDTFDCQGQAFDGTYPSCGDPIGENPALTGKMAFCNQAIANEPIVYIYHQVLLIR